MYVELPPTLISFSAEKCIGPASFVKKYESLHLMLLLHLLLFLLMLL